MRAVRVVPAHMKCKLVFLSAACTLALALPLVTPANPIERTSTQSDQRSINVTVYNDGNALVHDQRRIWLNAGVNRIAWRDVSATMDATSAIVDALNPRAQVSVLEQNFDYDVLGQDSILHAYVGKDVTVVHPPKFKGDRPHRERAKLLTADNGIVLQYRDRVETFLDGYIDFPGIPSSLRDQPTLTLDLQSPVAAMRDLDLRYLATGLSWHVDYVASLARDQHSMSLTGLVTLANRSGTNYRDARLQLIAGNVHQVPARALMKIANAVTSRFSDTYVNTREEASFGYHLYTIGHRTTILDKQTKQIGLLTARDVPVSISLEVRGANYYQQRFGNGDLGVQLPVNEYVSFVNRGGDLGIPLPAGTMRVYEDDSRGLSQFVGADNIGHTPKGEHVRLYLGDAFDLVARQKQTDFKLLTDCSASSSYDMEIHNAKDDAQAVTVIEPIPGDWTITAQSEAGSKTSYDTQTWTLPVPANGKTSLTYSVTVTWCKE